MNKSIGTAMLSSVLAIGTVPATALAAAGDPFNRIVVLVDASQSFKSRRLDAIERTQQLVHQLGTRRAKRWEAADQVVIISLDAIPEVLWEGNTRSLSTASRNDWASRFKARSDYAGCTDVQAALELALTKLEGTPRATGKYLIGFSDLVHEPPTHSPSACKPPKLPSVPPADFAWDRLADVSFSMFWLPAGQKLAWDRVMKEAGLSTYKLYTNSESGAVDVELPAPAVRKVTEQELARTRESAQSWLASLMTWALAGIASLILGIAAYLAYARLRHRRHAVAAGPDSGTPRAGRPVAGPVAPMILPRR